MLIRINCFLINWSHNIQFSLPEYEIWVLNFKPQYILFYFDLYRCSFLGNKPRVVAIITFKLRFLLTFKISGILFNDCLHCGCCMITQSVFSSATKYPRQRGNKVYVGGIIFQKWTETPTRNVCEIIESKIRFG